MIPICLELSGALLLGLSILAPNSIAKPLHAQEKIELLDHATLVRNISELVSAHPALVRASSIAESRAGRAVLVLQISGQTDPPAGTPAILLVAGLDGPRAYTSVMALHHAQELAARYRDDEAVTQLLDSTTIYIVPRLDVDACEARYQIPLAEVLASGHAIDNDRDGRTGEDGPSDVNGDGYVTTMRVFDPEGKWIEDPTDPRALIEADAKKGQRGKWKLLTEGLDSDDDEEVGEDPALDAVVNRNFPRMWEEHSAAAGLYPTDEPGALGLTEFLLAHADIALVVTYGEEGNLVEKPAQQDDDGATGGSVKAGVYAADVATYELLGERYRELTENKTKGLGEQGGSFQGFAYHHRGLFSLNIDPWSVPLDAKLDDKKENEAKADETAGEEVKADEGAEAATGEAAAPKEQKKDPPKPGDDAKRLIWFDKEGIDAFAAWQEFEHPQLGTLEIGGFLPFVQVEPPGSALAELENEHFDFLLSLGADLPRLELVDVEARALGGGLFEVEAALENSSPLPQVSKAAQRSGVIRPAKVQLVLPNGAELLAGDKRELVRALPGSGGRKEFRWLVGGVDSVSAIRVTFDTDNAGAQSVQVQEEVK